MWIYETGRQGNLPPLARRQRSLAMSPPTPSQPAQLRNPSMADRGLKWRLTPSWRRTLVIFLRPSILALCPKKRHIFGHIGLIYRERKGWDCGHHPSALHGAPPAVEGNAAALCSRTESSHPSPSAIFRFAQMAEGVGFEPTVPFTARSISSRVLLCFMVFHGVLSI